MRIELQWAFTEEDMRAGPCAVCEAEFTPRAVIARADQHAYDLGEVCEECLRWFSRRKKGGDVIPAPWPTWEEYRALVESHPGPMFASPEEMRASEPAGDPVWPAYDRSWLWVAESAR